MSKRRDQQPTGRWFTAYLLMTSGVCGALVMVIEVLGSRVIGPFFGVSLFVWTALITVTLVALALGYAAGGLLADRSANADRLYLVILAAGVLALLVPLLRGPVILACLPLGLRLGALTASLLLFGPSLFLLGMVSPFLVRLVARDLSGIGRTVGILSAVSTLGSFLGTVATGFFLIAWAGIPMIFRGVGLLLLALAAGYFLVWRRRLAAAGLLVLPLLIAAGAPPAAKTLADGTQVVRLHDRDSYYGNLKVLEYQAGPLRARELLIDGQVQGAVDMERGVSMVEYTACMAILPLALNPAGRDCLVVGLGAGIVPRLYDGRGVRTDVVDINPAIPGVARDFFGWAPSGEVAVADARSYLAAATKRWDYIVLDVFNGDTTPTHLLSVEAFRLLRDRLRPGGVLAVNLAGSTGRDTLMTASVLRTLGEVFPEVTAYPLFDPDGGRWGNVAVVAHNREGILADWRFDQAAVHPALAPRLARHLSSPFRFPADTPAIVLTDDFNPVDVHDIWLKEQCRRAVIEHTDPEMLL